MIPESIHIPVLLTLGFVIVVGFYLGKNMKWIRMPALIGYMILGVLLGPSLFNLLPFALQDKLEFITNIALSFVAISIGLEMKYSALKKLGAGILWIILFECVGAFIIVFAVLYPLTKDLVLSLVFAAIAPASAPAGTVAVIEEYKAKGSLTKALYAVVGLDDGVGIIMFGFTASICRTLLVKEGGGGDIDMLILILEPLKEVVLSFLIGGALGFLFSILARRMKNAGDVLLLLFGFMFASAGLCELLNLSVILTNMVVGAIVVNTQPRSLVSKIYDRLPMIMPLLFLLFFTLGGANLQVRQLPALGLIGLVYLLARSGGLIAGAYFGGIVGKVEEKIKKYLGLGILAQAGVAIGLSLVVKNDFTELGGMVPGLNGEMVRHGALIGESVITTITATSVIFGVIGPILAKIALQKAGEITYDPYKSNDKG